MPPVGQPGRSGGFLFEQITRIECRLGAVLVRRHLAPTLVRRSVAELALEARSAHEARLVERGPLLGQPVARDDVAIGIVSEGRRAGTRDGVRVPDTAVGIGP